jgi:hypothetical protein
MAVLERAWTLILVALALFVAYAQDCRPPSPTAVPSATLPNRYYYVFVLDTSASMMGLGDGKGRVIFPKVKEEVKRFVNQLPPDSRITIQTFDAGPGPSRTYLLPAEKEALLQYVDGLKAQGSKTYLYATLLEVLRKVEQNRRPNEALTLFLFTDGRDNDPGPLTMMDVTRKYRLIRGPYDWFYYISLGLATPEEVTLALKDLPNVRILDTPPNQVPSLSEVVLQPSVLDLGNLWQQDQVQRDLRVEARGPVHAIALEVGAPDLERAGAFLEVIPEEVPTGKTTTLTLKLRNRESLPPGVYQAWLCPKVPQATAVRPQAIPLRLAFHPPGEYTLEPTQVPEALRLRPGEQATLTYKLQGNAWAKDPVKVSLELPKGLRGTLNGEEGTVALAPGEELRVVLENTGLKGGKTVAPRLALIPPEGSSVQAPSQLPPVTQPMTLWDWLQHLWWLGLFLLLLLVFLWRINQPWGLGAFTTAPDKGCQDISRPLKGRVDVGKLFGEERLEGVNLTYRRNRVFLSNVPPGIMVKNEGMALEEGDYVDWEDRLTFHREQQELGTLQIKRK